MSEKQSNFKTVQTEAVELTTYSPDGEGSVVFTVPQQWLRNRIEGEGEVTLETFLDVYEWGAAEDIYNEALSLGVVLTQEYQQPEVAAQ